jgi:hypothetical protein
MEESRSQATSRRRSCIKLVVSRNVLPFQSVQLFGRSTNPLYISGAGRGIRGLSLDQYIFG